MAVTVDRLADVLQAPILAMADTRTMSDIGTTPLIRNKRRRRSHDGADHVEGNIGCIYVTADDAMVVSAGFSCCAGWSSSSWESSGLSADYRWLDLLDGSRCHAS